MNEHPVLLTLILLVNALSAVYLWTFTGWMLLFFLAAGLGVATAIKAIGLLMVGFTAGKFSDER